VEPTNAATPIAAARRIERADVILICPGSLFTSVWRLRRAGGDQSLSRLPNAKEDLRANLRRKIPETEGYTLQDHVDALVRHGVVLHFVLVDRRSRFASQHCSLPVHIAELSREMHGPRCAKMTEAVIAKGDIYRRRPEEQ